MCLFTSLAIGSFTAIGTAIASSVGATTVSTAAAATLGATATIAADLAVTGVLVGGVMGTVGAVQNAAQQKEMAEFQAQQEAENARLAKKEAEAIKIMGDQEKHQLRQKMLAQKSAGRTGYAASGVVLGSGTTLDYEADIADVYDSESRNLDYDIKSRQWQKQVAAANATDQAAMFRAQSKAAGQTMTMSLLAGTFSTIGNTASALMSAGGSFSKAGAFKKVGGKA
jgi:hypothetical protein